MSLRKPLKLKWEGKPYEVIITMETIDRLDSHVDVALLLANYRNGLPQMPKIAKLIWLILLEAGVEGITWEDVWKGMFDENNIDPKSIRPLVGEIFSRIFPETKKKPGKRRRQTKKSKVSTGSTSTK